MHELSEHDDNMVKHNRSDSVKLDRREFTHRHFSLINAVPQEVDPTTNGFCPLSSNLNSAYHSCLFSRIKMICSYVTSHHYDSNFLYNILISLQ